MSNDLTLKNDNIIILAYGLKNLRLS